jgi:hypothetical protein
MGMDAAESSPRRGCGETWGASAGGGEGRKVRQLTQERGNALNAGTVGRVQEAVWEAPKGWKNRMLRRERDAWHERCCVRLSSFLSNCVLPQPDAILTQGRVAPFSPQHRSAFYRSSEFT